MTSSRRERLAWLALIAVAALWRLPALGERAMSHDESLHAYYSYRYAELAEYRHDPMLHGPLLFHVGALVFLAAGDSDAAARLPVALAGIALVAAAWLFRRELGRRGALIAGALLVVSPSISFFSRYLRNDIYVALFTLLWLRALLDARAPTGERALRRLALWVALCFAAKEVAFLVGAIFGALLLVEAALRRGEAARRLVDLALFQLALVSPFVAGAALWATGAGAPDYDAPGAAAVTLAWALPSAAVALAGVWFRLRHSWPAAARELPKSFALAWCLLLALFTSLGTELRHGLASGIGGSLGYWLAQHDVARGGQPGYYYGMLGLLYEPLPWLLAIAAGLAALWRTARRRSSDADAFALLLAGWCIASWAALSLAGEKMPWLLVHLALPAILLAAWNLGRWSRQLDRGAAARLALSGTLAAAATLLAAGLAAHAPDGPRFEMRATLLAGALLTLAVWGARQGRRAGWRKSARAAALTATAAAAILTARTALLAGFLHDESAVELLVYAHGTPETPPAIAELERRSRLLAGEHALELAIDSEITWPLAWPLRSWPRQHTFTGEAELLELGSGAILAGPEADRALRARLAFTRDRLPLDLVRWPLETYRSWTAARALAAAADAAAWRRGVAFFFFRERLGADLAPWPLRKAAAFYLPPLVLGATPTLPLTWLDWPELGRVDAALDDPGRPALGSASASDGSRYEADPASRQLRRFDALGELAGESRLERLPLGLPSGLAWDDGRQTVWVADPGRRQLVAVDRDWRLVTRLEAPLWDREDRPGVAVLDDGRVVASVPAGDALVVWSVDLRPSGVVRLDPYASPGALAVGADGRVRVGVRDAILDLRPDPND